MTIVNNKVVFKFTKEDIIVLRQLADMVFEECGMYVKFSDIISDVLKDSNDRTYDFTSIDTFSIELEK